MHVHIHECLYVCTWVCRLRVYTYTWVCIYVYIYIYIHTYICRWITQAERNHDRYICKNMMESRLHTTISYVAFGPTFFSMRFLKFLHLQVRQVRGESSLRSAFGVWWGRRGFGRWHPDQGARQSESHFGWYHSEIWRHKLSRNAMAGGGATWQQVCWWWIPKLTASRCFKGERVGEL